MNACDTSKLPKGAQVLDDPKAAKKIHWVQDIDRKATRKLNKRIKVITQKEKNPNYDPTLFETCKDIVREKSMREEMFRTKQHQLENEIFSSDDERLLSESDHEGSSSDGDPHKGHDHPKWFSSKK